MLTRKFFSRGSDRWCYRTSTLMETSTHEGFMKKQPCLYHHGRHPRRTCLTSGRSSRSRRSPCPNKLLGSTPQSCRRLPSDTQPIQETPLSRSNKWCVDDEPLALVLQMIVSPTLNSLSQDLDLVERRFEWKQLGDGQIKIHMIRMEYLGLNTSEGGSM